MTSTSQRVHCHTYLLIYSIYQQVIESPSKNSPPIRELQGKTVNNLYKIVTWLIIRILFYSTDTHFHILFNRLNNLYKMVTWLIILPTLLQIHPSYHPTPTTKNVGHPNKLNSSIALSSNKKIHINSTTISSLVITFTSK